ncbi:MAG: molybdenum cofactor guanylyltransferase [Thermoanaerobaculia bacterium]|nr:molybdenum cofactor guanylyltransferase [Thermoanaerobaculia bacterium]
MVPPEGQFAMMARDPSTRLATPSAAVVGVVLAGGESRRMGTDKAVLPWRDGTLTSFAQARLAAVCQHVVVCDRGRQVLFGTRSVPDGPGAGPAAGLLGAAAVFPRQPLLVLACDLPGVPAALLQTLWDHAAGADLVVPVSPRGPEPLVGFYSPAALAALARAVQNGRFALYPLLEDPALRVVLLGGEALARFGPSGELFRNVNTAEDYDRVSPSGSAA